MDTKLDEVKTYALKFYSKEEQTILRNLKIGQNFYVSGIKYTGPRTGTLSMSPYPMP